jgi:hypothetical protein
MKRLTCELCGSNDFVKEDGLFVCQSCGTKYSVEEAKKMMVEGTVEVTGSVQIDRSKEIENKIQNAIREFNNGNYDRSISLCMDVLNEDPDNYLAIMYKALSDGWKGDVQNIPFDMVVNEVGRAIDNVRAMEPDDEKYADKVSVCILEVGKLAFAIGKYFDDQYNKTMTQVDNLKRHVENLDRRVKSGDTSALMEVNRLQQTGLIDIIKLETEGLMAVAKSSQPRAASVRFCEKFVSPIPIENMPQSMIEVLQYYNENIISKLDHNKVEECKKIKSKLNDYKVLQARRVEEYWENHPQEKGRLDDIIAAGKEDISRISKEINSKNAQIKEIEETIRSMRVPSIQLREELSDQIRTLRNQRDSLSVLKVKEKKALTAEIDALNAKMPSMQRVTKEKEELKAQHQPRIKEIEKEIEILTKEKNEKQNEIDQTVRKLKMSE